MGGADGTRGYRSGDLQLGAGTVSAFDPCVRRLAAEPAPGA